MLILFQGNLFAQDSTQNAGARLIFADENYNFGEVSNDTLLTHIFEFENPGTDTLFIESVRGSWGCTASLLSSEVIPPGESGELKVTFSTKKKHGISKKTIYIYSNDRDSKVKRIYVRANISKIVSNK